MKKKNELSHEILAPENNLLGFLNENKQTNKQKKARRTLIQAPLETYLEQTAVS